MSVETSATATVRPAAVAGPVAGAHRNAVAALTATGLGRTDVVHVVEYVTAAALAAYDQVEAAREAVFGDHLVPVATVPVEGLPASGTADAPAPALAVELTAHPGGGTLIGVRPDRGFHRGTVRVAGDVVYLPSVHPLGADGGLVHPGDFRAQYRHCLEDTAAMLAAAGLGPEALVQTTDYTARATRAEYPRCGRPRRDLLGGVGTDGRPVLPGAAGILVDQPVVAGAMVSLDALASTAPLRAVNPGWRRYDTLTYRPGVVAGGTLFMSGFAALDPVTQQALSPGDLLAQAEFTYASISRVLREAGATGDSVVRLVEYLTPRACAGSGAASDARTAAGPTATGTAEVGVLARLAELRRAHFGPKAAVTSVICSALLRPEFLIEVVPTVVLR